MSPRFRSVIVPIGILMAYVTLMSGGSLPSTHWQLSIICLQSLLLTFLTTYLGWVSLRVCDPSRFVNESATQQASSEASQLLVKGIQELPVAVLLVSVSKNRLLFANKSALQLLEMDWIPHDLLTSRPFDTLGCFEAFRVSHADNWECPMVAAARKCEPVTASNIKMPQSNGEFKTVSVTAIPLFDNNNLCHSVVALLQDVTDYQLQIERIKETANTDALTGLPNRLAILQQIQGAFDRGDSGHFGLLFLDFDRFKLINDSLGHDIGDLLLIEIGQRIRKSLRAVDCVCVPSRLGGDEFVVFLDAIPDPSFALQIADRLLVTLGEPYQLAGNSVVSTASIGIVTSDQHVESATDMLRNADLAMYKSKTNGKARYSVFDDSMKREVEQQLQLENELRMALKYDEFDFDLQSVIDLRTRVVVGGEALLRWQHPRLGRISANQFVGVASETGLIVPIGDQLVRKACQFASSMDVADPKWRLHVNISRLQLSLPSLTDLIDDAIAESGIAPERLVLEIAEASIKDEPDKVIERLHELKAKNIRICLDNFGSGASPLALLKELPIDFLKLDRTLVQAIETSPESCVLLEALVAISGTYQIEVIAEGIENESQVSKLCQLGCVFGQGYVLRRPVEANHYLQVEHGLTDLLR